MTLAINYTDEGRIVYRYLVQRSAGRGVEVIGEIWAEHDDEAAVLFRELYPHAERFGVFCLNRNDEEIGS
jgi:hypothetical protein